MEAIALAFGLAPEGGTRNVQERTRPTESALHEWITLEKTPGASHWGFFRAETMHGYFTRQASYSSERDPHFHELSHTAVLAIGGTLLGAAHVIAVGCGNFLQSCVSGTPRSSL